jgi:hypothetical protein
MVNANFDQNLAFDTELSIAASTFTGSSQLLGTLTNEPVIMLIKNLSSVIVFFADNNGSTKGTTMAAGEEIVLDCRANSGRAPNMGFPINTSFYVTAAAGTGTFKVSVIYAK